MCPHALFLQARSHNYVVYLSLHILNVLNHHGTGNDHTQRVTIPIANDVVEFGMLLDRL